MTKVKICGITNLEDALHAVECGADELGFNFYSGSKRYIAPQAALEIVAAIPQSVANIGVFVNEPIESVIEISDHVGLGGIQLHGEEEQHYIVELRARARQTVIKAFRISNIMEMREAMDRDYDLVLFDSFSPTERGGTGITLDWDTLGVEIYLWFPHLAYLAGGLTPDNVATAVRKLDLLYAVDVASGVESSPGKKDPIKVEAFIEAVRSVEN